MKKLLFTLCFLLFAFYSNSQTIFNKRYEGLGSETTRNLIIQQENYFTVGGDYVNSTLGIVSCKTDLEGNFVESKFYADTLFWFHGRENSLSSTKTGNYILGGGRDMEYYRDNLLIKFDENFDTIFTKTYYPVNDGGNSDVIIHNTNIDIDGGYLLVGQTNIDNDYNILPKYKMQLIKTDTLGNLLWRKIIGFLGYKYYGYKVTPAFGGGYILAGWCDKNGGDNVVIKVDENCENPVYRYYGHPTYDDGRIMGVTPTKDSCYLISTVMIISNNGSYNITKARLIKIDSDLNTVWDRTYFNPGRASYFVNALEKPNGHIVLHGSETYYEEKPVVSMMELTATGDSLGKQATTTFDIQTTDNFGENAKLTPDGGMIIAGWCTSYLMEPSQQMFLIKVDSRGCDGTQWTSCGSVDIIEPIAQNNTEAGLRVYPNPTNKNLTLTLSKREGTLAEQLINVGALQEQKGAFNKRSYSTNKQKLSDLPTNVAPSLLERVWGEASIREKLKYNIKHPEQKLWGKAEEKEMLELSRKHAIMLPFDVLRGESDIFAIEPSLRILSEPRFSGFKDSHDVATTKKIENKQSKIEIYDIYGRLVKSVNRTFQFDEEITINVSNLQKGIYLLRVGGESVKFVKE